MHYQPAEFYWIPENKPLNRSTKSLCRYRGFCLLVVPTFSTIEVQLLRPRLNGTVVIDGQIEFKIGKSKIRVQRSETDISFIRFKDKIEARFYDKGRDKIIFSRKLADDSLDT